jgi:hypothetical protein
MTDIGNQIILKSVTEQLQSIMRGEKGVAVATDPCNNPALNELCGTVNDLIATFNDMREFVMSLAEGNLEVSAPPRRNLLASPYKQLQANLLHLVWQTQQIAAGDYTQRVQFMGDFSSAFNSMVEALEEKKRTEKLLQEEQAKVRHLEGIIPICMYCKKIRDDMESWQQLEQYITEHSEAMFSHGICPDCYGNLRTDLDHMKKRKENDK